MYEFEQIYKEFYLIPLKHKDEKYNGKEALSSFNTSNDKFPLKSFKDRNFGIGAGHNNLHIVDIDNHFDDAKEIYEELNSMFPFDSYPVVKTGGGGYHIYFYCDSKKQSSRKLARRINSKGKPDAVIETREGNSYVVSPFMEGYELIQGDLLNIPNLSEEEKEELYQYSVTFNEYIPEEKKTELNKTQIEGERSGDLFNKDSACFSKIEGLLSAHGWTRVFNNRWRRPDKNKGISATFGAISHNGIPLFHNFSSSESFTTHTPFTMYAELAHGGDFKEAAKDLGKTYNTQKVRIDKKKIRETSDKEVDEELDQFERTIRVGDNFFYIRKNSSLESRNRGTIVDDLGKEAPKRVKKYVSFCNIPSHTNYQQTYDNCGDLEYNLYEKLSYKPKKGKFPTILKMFDHVFGDQIDMAIDWVQIAYLNPSQKLPVIVLNSQQEGTGKGSFSRLMRAIFEHNYAKVTMQSYQSEFNSPYASKSIIHIEEGSMEKSSLDKLKMEVISEIITLRRMRCDGVEIPFFGKYIIESNDADCLKINDDSNRFWFRVLKPFVSYDSLFDEKIKKEMPFFVDHIMKRKLSNGKKESRFWFKYSLYKAETFKMFVNHSRDQYMQEFIERMYDVLCNKGGEKTMSGTPSRLKDAVYPEIRDKLSSQKIKKFFISEMKLEQQNGSHTLYSDDQYGILHGRYFTIKKTDLEPFLI